MKKRNIGKRILASLLAVVLLVGNLSTLAAAATSDSPVEPTQAVAGEKPTIELQGNVVKDQFGKLTGFFELALRVKTPTTPDYLMNETFRELMVALKYNANTMIPVDWDTPDENGVVEHLDLSSTAKYKVQQPSKKADGITMSAALTYGHTYVAGEEGQKLNLLYFHAESYKGVSLPQMTTLAVIRFQIDPSIQANFTLDANGNPLYNGNPADLTQFVDFAADKDVPASPAGQAMYYESGANEFYYTPVTAVEQVRVPDPVSSANLIDAPATKGKRVLALGPDSTAPANVYYSFYTNLLEKGTDFNLTMVSEESYAKTSLDINKLCVITYMDWDDTIIGTQVVPQKADVRKLVNDYVKENFVHTDLENNTNYSSVARIDNYRGKYPASGPAPAGTPSGVTDGEDFPLTNKLDYVFLKRPMEYNSATGTWMQATNASGAPVYDAAYPYTHGWALCASSGTAENTWTTLGSTGELSSYSVNSTTGAASFKYGGTGFTVADFGAGFDKREIYVKAMYEPGKNLLGNVYPYEMVGEPYFSKYNELAAAVGGAYSVSVQYSRTNSSTDNGVVKGVERMRSPSLRQETTTDLKWESDHTLPNATTGEAQAKTKTTFTYVPTSGVETVNVEMALSARANKVDFFLVERYGMNFIAGGERSLTYSTDMLDNYAYSEASNAYDTKNGTIGFVFTGTLNTILKKASQKVLMLDTGDFALNVTYSNINDINLYNKNREPYTSTTFVTQGAANTILAAVQEAYNQRLLGPTENWDDDHNCANLSYHQLQNYILTNTLVSKAAADDLVFPWCRLHQKCIDDGATGVTDWASLLENAYQYKTNTAAKDAVDNMLPSLMVGFGLAKNANGTLFASSDLSSFISYIVAAAQAAGATNYASLTIAQVQYYILNGSYTDAGTAQIAREQEYWWFDVSVKPNNWNTLVSAAKLTYPAALNTAKSAYDAMMGTPSSNTVWLQLTYNLAADVNGSPFATFDAFKTAFKAAVTALNTAGYSAPTWAQVQYYILNHTAVNASDAQAASSANYWWYNGGQKITDLASLLAAASAYNQGNTAAYASFTYDLLYSTANTAFQFCKSFDGTKYEDNGTDLDQLKTALAALVNAKGTNLAWSQIQYYLIHGALNSSNIAMNTESTNYYWWKEGGAPQAKTVTSVATLLAASFASARNGNAVAWDNLTLEQIKALYFVEGFDNTVDEVFDDLDHYIDVDDFTQAMDALINLAVTASGDAYTVPSLTWYQIQHYLVDPAGNGLVEESTILDKENLYWWLTKPSNPAISLKTPLDTLLERMVLYVNSGNDITKLNAAEGTWPGLINNNANSLNFVSAQDNLSFRRLVNGTAFTTAQMSNPLLTKIRSLATLAVADPAYYDSTTQKLNLTWYQVQAFVISGSTIPEPAEAKATVEGYISSASINASTWRPTWLTSTFSFGTMAFSLTVAQKPSTSTEITTSPDGLTTTTTETVTTQDAAGDTVITTTVTAVTTSTVETESEHITTTVITTAVTTVTISTLTGQPMVTTTSETTTTTERVPLEAASPAPEETTEPDATIPEETTATETGEPDITDPAASPETETAAQPETAEETKTETGSEKETTVSQEPAALPPDTGEYLRTSATVSLLWSSPPSGYPRNTLLSGSGLPALSGTWGGTTRSWFYRREGPRWSNLFLTWASPGITVISRAWGAGLDFPLRGGELEPSRRTVT